MLLHDDQIVLTQITWHTDYGNVKLTKILL